MTIPNISVGAIFVVAAALKLQDIRSFCNVLRQFLPDVGSSGTRAVALAVAMVEGLVGLALVSGLLHPWPEAAAICLLAVFSGAVAAALLRSGPKGSCGCMSQKSTMGWHVCVRNFGLVALLATGLTDVSALQIAGLATFICAFAISCVMATREPSLVPRSTS